jgi:hypothetical protein
MIVRCSGSTEEGPMQLTAKGVDYASEELSEQTPFEVRLLRQIPGSDRPDYWLGSVSPPLRWVVDGAERAVTHVVLASRYAGQGIRPGAVDVVVGISYVTDPSLLDDAQLTFAKCAYVAIGVCQDSGAAPSSVGGE